MEKSDFILTELKEWLDKSIPEMKGLVDNSKQTHDGMETTRLQSKYETLVMVKGKIDELEK